MATMRLCIWTFFLVFEFSSIGRSGENPKSVVHYLTFEDAVQIALHDNVDLLALREQEETLKHQSKQALGPNEPVLSFINSDVPSFSLTQTPAQAAYQLSWTLGFPGKALAQSASVSHQAEAMAEQASNQEITLITSLSNSYIAFVTNDAFYNFLLEEQRKDRELIRLLEKRYGASQAAKVDLLNAKVVTEQIAQSILQNRNDYDLLLTQFRQLIKKPTDKSFLPKIPEKIIIPPVNQSFDDLVNMMSRNNHSIAQARRVVDSTSSQLTNARLQALPDFQLTAGINNWTQVAAPNPGVTQDYTIGVGITVPIFFAFNELEGVHAAEHTKGAAEYQLTSQQLQGINGLQTAYASLKATLKDLEASEKLVVPAAKESYDLTLLTYGFGKSDYISLNQSRKAWHDAMRDMFTKRQNAAQFYNQLISQIGCDISKAGGANACH